MINMDNIMSASLYDDSNSLSSLKRQFKRDSMSLR